MKANRSECESVQGIMERVSHYDLLSHYLGVTKLPVLINSPLREDSNPSFYIYSPRGTDKVRYKDYATGERGDIYSLLQRQKGVTFSQLMHEISEEKSFATMPSQTVHREHHYSSGDQTIIRVKVREWQQHDVEYWESYGISLPWLKFAEVYPISHEIVYKEGQRYVFHAAKYAYVFVERKEGNISLKVYQPLVKDKRRKWHSSNDGSVVGLWTKVPPSGEKLCICSSLKDSLCLWANIGIPCIYVQSENTKMSNTAISVLKSRFKHIYICLDNDNPGLRGAEQLASETGFQNVILPQFEEGKDIADLYHARGKEEFIRIMKPLYGE